MRCAPEPDGGLVVRVVTVNTNYAGGGAAAVARTVHEQIRGRGDMDSRFLHSYGRSNADAAWSRVGLGGLPLAPS